MKIKEVIDVKVNMPESLKSNCIVGELGINIDNMEVCFTMKQMRKIKTEIEKLERQLKEANEVIKGYEKYEDLINHAFGKVESGPAQKYLERWGVK